MLGYCTVCELFTLLFSSPGLAFLVHISSLSLIANSSFQVEMCLVRALTGDEVLLPLIGLITGLCTFLSSP